jgi:hypothetical protein
MPSSPRRLTILAGLGSLALIVLAATVGRKEILTQYHLFRLRRDPAYFPGILGDPEGTPRRAAVRRYLESADGKSALIRECLPPSRAMQLVGFSSRQTPHVNVYVSLQQIKLSTGGGLHYWHDPREHQDRRALIHEYVVNRHTVTLTGYDGMEFEIRKVRDARSITREEEAGNEPKTR